MLTYIEYGGYYNQPSYNPAPKPQRGTPIQPSYIGGPPRPQQPQGLQIFFYFFIFFICVCAFFDCPKPAMPIHTYYILWLSHCVFFCFFDSVFFFMYVNVF